eukprot:CAMPEP_0171451896 /NCGR_PEP_ID=MMETSP0945-20130129/218_1 /TAXON_ID=109269 /ORGANISM="Vaucheria litorea, Strain CCMP2940" /LENGTH=297 /DNA_ID=CAMNT_0011976449 /DNA_START=127 /DNA_END=1020 /DNA_ORIENTATION=+
MKFQRMSMTSTPMDKNKMLHVVYRVGNLEKTIEFYKNVFGMELLRHRDIPEDKYTNAFLGYGTESEGKHFSIELTYNYGVDSYTLGDGFKGISLELPNIRKASKKVEELGGEVTFGPEDIEYGPCMIPDEPITKKSIATVMKLKDPEGYGFEATERVRRDPVSKVCLSVLNLDVSVAFYEKALGMKVLYKRSNVPREASMVVGLGYGDAEDSTILELYYAYTVEKIEMGDAYGQIAVSTADVYEAAKHVQEAGYNVTREPGPVPGIGTKVTALRDPDGFKIVLVDEEDFEKELAPGV